MSLRSWWKRSSRRAAHPTQSPQGPSAEALYEARKGTAAEHPALVVTPDRKMHSGAFVDGVFIEARPTGVSPDIPRDEEQHARDVASGEIPGPNPAMEKKWWVRGAAHSSKS